MHLPKTKHKNVSMLRRNLVHASLYCKIIIETLIEFLLCNSFNFKIVNGIMMKLHAIYSLIMDSLITIHRLTRCTHAKPTGKLGLARA